MRTVLFICTGNTCRSPLAEGIARHLVAQGVEGLDDDLFIASAGVMAPDGVPISPESEDALSRRGIDAEGATSKRLTPEMIREADLVLGMTASHVDHARRLAGIDCTTPIERVDPDGDIDDPIGMGQEIYDRVADRLDEVIPGRLRELLSPVKP